MIGEQVKKIFPVNPQKAAFAEGRCRYHPGRFIKQRPGAKSLFLVGDHNLLPFPVEADFTFQNNIQGIRGLIFFINILAFTKGYLFGDSSEIC
jgi:hypothetical protein